jgi:fructose-bisphosphate aldolase class II
VLHGGSGVQQESLRRAITCGIAKINIGADIRQPYEAALRQGATVSGAQQAVYERTRTLLHEWLGLSGTRGRTGGSDS